MKVLIADDNGVTRRTLATLVEHLGHDAIEAEDGHSAWQILSEPDAPALILLDWMMPGPDGIEICRRLHGREKRPRPHVLMISARDAVDDLVQSIEAGADGYVRKPFDLREVRAHVRAAERILAAQDELRSHAVTDALTGVLNRRGLTERLQHELALVARDGRDLSVLIIDVDHFKSVNDTHGHAVGDEVLSALASRMQAQLRAYDDIARYGGEEFAVVLPACAGAGALTAAERIRKSVSAAPVNTPTASIPITVSVGVVSVDTLSAHDAADVLARADRALYAAKAAGRDAVCDFNALFAARV